MGKFFNENVMNSKRIPLSRELEKLRRKYNEKQQETKIEPEEVKVDGWAKAREAKARKKAEREANG